MLKINYKKLLSPVLLAGILLSACSSQKADNELLTDALLRPESANYETITVRTDRFQSESFGTASVAFMKETALSYKNSGAKYKEIHAQLGNPVSAGDVLVTFEVTADQSEKESLTLQLSRKQEDYQAGKEAKQNAIEAQKALAASLTSYERQLADLQVEMLQIEYEQFVYSTEREIKQLQQQIAELSARLTDTKLAAPCDGIITYIATTSTGDDVTPNSTLIKILSPDKLLLQVRDGGDNLRYNLPVTLQYGAGNKVKILSGRVVVASNILPSGLKQDKTLIQIDEESEMEFRSYGASYEFCAFTQDIGNALVTSKTALNMEKGRTFVYILDNDVIRKRYVTAQRSTGDTAWILDGLSAGQNLILG